MVKRICLKVVKNKLTGQLMATIPKKKFSTKEILKIEKNKELKIKLSDF